MRKVLILIIAVLLTYFVYGQSDNFQLAQQTLEDRGEVYFTFDLADDAMMQKTVQLLAKIISIDKVTDNEVIAYANKSEFARFIDFGIDYEVLTPPSLLYKPKSVIEGTIRNTDDWDFYPSYEEYINMMTQFATDYPNLCELVNIGSSGDGRDILFIHINNNLGVVENEPEFMYTSTMHGDEVTGYVLMLRYIEYLLQNYGTITEVTNLVNNVDIWINPLANPDGTYAGGNSSVYGATRSNANGIDLNRNFADPEDGLHPDGNPYQVETLAFMVFAANHNFVMSSNIHGGAEVVNYPWDTYYELSPDNAWWIYVSREYADYAQANSPSGYLTDLNNGITNGAAWYSISGGRQDYMNYFHNCREMTLEISSDKMPPENQLPDFWEYNYQSFNKYMGQSLFGFSGLVTDANTGNPVEAQVFINNHDALNTWVFSHEPLGNYFRPMIAGSYDVTFSSYGYFDQTINNVVITNEFDYELNVELIPYSTLTADFTSSETVISTGSSVDFYDNSWGNNINSWTWTFEGGNPEVSYVEDPSGIIYSESGIYDVTLTVRDVDGNTDTKFIDDYILVTNSYNMSNETVTTCDALFLDSGGEGSEYSDDENFVMIFLPEVDDSSVKMEFVSFSVESQDQCDYDYMEIFDGVDVNAPLIGKWCGSDGPGTIIANNEEGALTVYFHSDNSVTFPGWKAIVTCDSNVGVVQHEKMDFTIFPNPASNQVQIIADDDISNITISDLSGRVLYYFDLATGNHIINTSDFERGVYLLSFKNKGNNITRKIVLN